MFASSLRMYQIARILIRYRLHEYLPDEGIFRWLRLGAHLHPAYYKKDSEDYSLGRRLRLALQDLGPIFVKLGQTLSTRPDLLSPELLAELSKLQDKVPPFSGEEAKQIIETALGQSVDTIFTSFDETALASASVAQVHAATLKTGENVVVKVLRPGVEKAVAADIALMYQLARLASYTHDGRRLRPVEVVREFENTMSNELDLMFEAANASQLRVNFKDSPLLYVPEVHWPYCRKNIMVMERIYATNIADQRAIIDAGTNLKVLAERGVEIFFTQVFRDSFFHADMHPGNIFVYTDEPQTPRYCAIDFGIMGSLTPEDQHYLAENFLAFFNRDYRRVAELHVESGWVPSDTRITDFEAAIRKVSEPIFGKPIKEISFGSFLVSLFQTARRFDMHIQPQLVLLQKTFFNVEGLGRRLYPDLDLWITAKPVLEAWMKTQIGSRAVLKQMRYNAHEYAKVLPQLPLLAHRALQQFEQPTQKISSPSNTINTRLIAGTFLLIAAIALWICAQPQGFWQNSTLVLMAVSGLWQWLKKN
ncbi:MAG: ubiquinone biosynthesis regulatory protein kinase UbiB [Cardiobacteriaceae bacterium]|nr:ubiquinone biosynthesis regulatory protein kinase UbiB [Cardiobacteriaceae bacterium]